MTSSLIWFRNDLRLDDNIALAAARAAGEKTLALYILDDTIGAAARWWLHHSLAALAADLQARGAMLVLRRGNAAEIIPELAAEIDAGSVHAACSFSPALRRRDQALEEALGRRGIVFHLHPSASLFAPGQIRTRTGGLYGVYGPFARACFETGVPQDFVAAPAHIPGVTGVKSDRLEDWGLLPRHPDWAGGLRESWTPGEAGAQARLQAFLAGPVQNYATARDHPGLNGTSKLSPHVHFGEISPRRLWHVAAVAGPGDGVKKFRGELLWREFSLNLLWQHPDLRREPIRREFAAMPWRHDESALRAWQRGRTGIPIVDAGMRELWQTGWMHNRVRMICASFLTKHLLLPWQEGETWFWDTLCEADEAANGASWQWVAGCGADAAPYFRVFNPVLQGRKFDADGAYVRRYVPELALLPDADIHAPWEASAETLGRAGVELGKTYKLPIVSLSEGRARALAAYARIKA
ncbi:MAG TPA: deoxyribodipyrimidine photo-lyase [Acidocella sp.]|uniref:cryptochrome/photolyase family protein n=1 Tax=Acidocella sp. TaxID=50710 RepID=UPI002B887A79|nr:deoxyribodipyrimidine photo-lyase [Acidocella sp.]HVE21611.1 deoxyribodipyrimidine photo-lyase [Acidocella sp.]